MASGTLTLPKSRKTIWTHLRRHRLGPFSAGIVVLVILCATFAPYVSPQDPLLQRTEFLLMPPGPGAPLGTDELGGDVLSRLIYGARFSVAIGVASVALGAVIGLTSGLLAGYRGGATDMAITSVMDILLSFPGVLLAILIMSMLGSGVVNVIVVVAVFSIPVFARITRASAVQLRAQEFVEAAKALGASEFRVLWHHILRNSLASVIIYATLRVATAILVAASLSFLGLGVSPPTPEWGAMISTGREYFREAPHTVIVPGGAIFLTVLSFNILGDILRDALDPRLKV